MSEKKKAAAAALLIFLCTDETEKECFSIKHSVWVREWLEKRSTDGAHQKLLPEFRNVDGQQHLFFEWTTSNRITYCN